MAGRTATQNWMYMTTLALLREVAAADTLSATAAKALFEADPQEGIIYRRDDKISTGTTVDRKGLNYGYDGLMRLVVYPATSGGALPANVAVYARFLYSEKAGKDQVVLPDPVLVGKFPKGDAEGAVIVEIPNPPGDCELVVLADAAARIFYSQSV